MQKRNITFYLLVSIFFSLTLPLNGGGAIRKLKKRYRKAKPVISAFDKISQESIESLAELLPAVITIIESMGLEKKDILTQLALFSRMSQLSKEAGIGPEHLDALIKSSVTGIAMMGTEEDKRNLEIRKMWFHAEEKVPVEIIRNTFAELSYTNLSKLQKDFVGKTKNPFYQEKPTERTLLLTHMLFNKKHYTKKAMVSFRAADLMVRANYSGTRLNPELLCCCKGTDLQNWSIEESSGKITFDDIAKKINQDTVLDSTSYNLDELLLQLHSLDFDPSILEEKEESLSEKDMLFLAE